MNDLSEKRLHSPSYFAPKPTRFTRFMRVFIPWQVLRFLWINFKMTVLILKSHH
jgi:hypothetical protein